MRLHGTSGMYVRPIPERQAAGWSAFSLRVKVNGTCLLPLFIPEPGRRRPNFFWLSSPAGRQFKLSKRAVALGSINCHLAIINWNTYAGCMHTAMSMTDTRILLMQISLS